MKVLEKSWKDIQDITKEIDNRKAFIVKVNKNYYPYVLPTQIDKSIEDVDTDFSAMDIIIWNELNYTTTVPAKFATEPVESWIKYEVEFLNINEALLPFIRSEIILRVGKGGNISGDSSNFRIREGNLCVHQRTYQKITDTHFILNHSLYLKKLSEVSISNSIATVITSESLPSFYSKLSLKFYNPQNTL